MKKLYHFPLLIYLFTRLFFSACVDDLTKVGMTIQPPEDFITVYSDTFQMKASTVILDSIYAKTSDCLLGEMYDPTFGIIKADLLCQFYCEEGFTFFHKPIGNKIDSVVLYIYYPLNEYGGIVAFGDTLTPMQVTVFPVNKPLMRNFYTNDDPTLYCDMENPLGSATYTLYDMTVPYELREAGEYAPAVRIKLPTALGQKLYDETLNNPSTFNNQNSFNEFFPGIYITNTYGSGCFLKTIGEYIEMRIYYSIPYEPDINDDESYAADSVEARAQFFYVSKDVIQVNRFTNSNIDQLLVDNSTHTYVKSPAGVCTKLVLPTTQISKEIDINDRFINGFSLDLRYLPDDEWNFAYHPPQHLLLLPEDSLISFFENSNVENNITSFISFSSVDSNGNLCTSANATWEGYSSNSRTYTFGNISRLLKTHIESSPDRDLSLLVVPVTRKFAYDSYYGMYYSTGITHSFFISGTKIRTEDEYMKVIVLSSKYEEK